MIRSIQANISSFVVIAMKDRVHFSLSKELKRNEYYDFMNSIQPFSWAEVNN